VIQLWYVEFVSGNLGIWDRSWHATKKEAYDQMIWLTEQGYSTDRDDGSFGSLTPVKFVEVALTLEGVLAFARNFAVDTGSC